MAFVFYDLETTGTDRQFDQVLQFAAIRTDPDLNELERVNLRCRLLPHQVPSPGALAVTRVSMEQILDRSLPSHYEMVCQIVSLLERWSPAIFLGWNTLEFDEEMLRQAFYQCLHSPYLTNTNGNGRTDLLRFCQALNLLQPGTLQVPTGPNGKPSMKLELLAPANGLPHLNAHDALADVEATIHLCRLVQDRAPDLWSDALRFCPKASALAFMQAEAAFLVTECYFGRPYRYALTMLGADPANGSSVLAYDLEVDPADLRGLTDEHLARRLKLRVKPVRRVKANKSPMLAEIWSVPSFNGATPEQLTARAEHIQADEELRARLIAAAERQPFEKSDHVESQIYDGFPCHADKGAMQAFHSADWPGRAAIVESLQDQRLIQLGRRLVFHHSPEHLHPPHRRSLEAALARRMLGHGSEVPWLTLANAGIETEQMLGDCADEARAILNGLKAHVTAETARCRAILAAHGITA